MTEHLTDLMERLAHDAPPLRADLVADSMRRGARLRHRRNALRMAGASALVAAAIVGVAAIPRDTPRTTSPEPPVASTSAPPVADVALTEAVRDVFAPYGQVSEPDSRLELDFAGMTAVLTDPDGHSAGIAVTVTTYDGYAFPTSSSSDGPPPTTCAEVDGADYQRFQCHEVGGALVVSYRVSSFADERDQGAFANAVEVRHPDGLITVVRSYNSLAEKAQGAMLDKPLLDTAQLQTVALDPLWRRVQLGTE